MARAGHVQGYLAALSASSYSYVSMLQRFAPLMNEGGAAISLTYIASERIVPGALCAGRWLQLMMQVHLYHRVATQCQALAVGKLLAQLQGLI